MLAHITSLDTAEMTPVNQTEHHDEKFDSFVFAVLPSKGIGLPVSYRTTGFGSEIDVLASSSNVEE